MTKRNFLFFILFLFILVYKVDAIMVTPPSLEFDITKGGVICKTIVLKNDEAIDVSGRDVWTNVPSSQKVLSAYNNSSQDFNLDIQYEKNIQNLQTKEINICIKGEKLGGYYGALIYKVGGGSISTSVVIWIRAGIYDNGEITNSDNNQTNKPNGESSSFSRDTTSVTTDDYIPFQGNNKDEASSSNNKVVVKYSENSSKVKKKSTILSMMSNDMLLILGIIVLTLLVVLLFLFLVVFMNRK